MVGKLIAALEGGELEKAKWLAEATARSNGVSKVESSKHSTRTLVPLCAVDLPTLLDTLLEIQTSTGPLVDSTSSGKLKSLASSLRKSSTSDLPSGKMSEPGLGGEAPLPKRLPSNRRYWPQAAKSVFWDLVRDLNKYDKEFAKGDKKSPIQLPVAEEATRRWWRLEYDSP